jgi:hypothetical protein
MRQIFPAKYVGVKKLASGDMNAFFKLVLAVLGTRIQLIAQSKFFFGLECIPERPFVVSSPRYEDE